MAEITSANLRTYSVIAKRGIQAISSKCRAKWFMNPFDRVIGKRTRAKWIIGEHYTWSTEVQASSTFITLRSPINAIRSSIEWSYGSCTLHNLKRLKGRIKKAKSKKIDISYVDFLSGSTKLSLQGKKSLVLERLQLSAWIGLTDYFNASICVLQNLYPHLSHPAAHSNMRKTILKTPSFSKKKESAYACSPENLQNVFGPSLKDDIDVYVHAVGMFTETILKRAPECARFITSISSYEPLQAKSILNILSLELRGNF